MAGSTASTAPVVNAGSWRTTKQTSTQRGYGYKWQQARIGYLAKHPYCVMCLAAAGVSEQGIEEITLACLTKGMALPRATVVDHKVPHRGDMTLFWDSTKWQALCKPCHDSHAQRRDKAIT
ncbi:HNH endonuclease [Massilia sp. CCM 8694]|uniref:HNH endonuclease n=2 Tax=Massilia genomosp. 1 TaxID=2609280 RepID=A0ABX0MIM2_9BURK|nr:HNH endonuclease signature motif containing protein [Massilia genomosp. 1]NHZ62624.1 HNH endonuclease [Massilia genomosp. 1]